MEAEAYYKKAIHICENILDKKTLVRALYEIAVNNYSLANIYCYSKLKNDDLFLFYHEKSLSFIERYESETGFIPFGFNSVSCYFMIAFYYLGMFADVTFYTDTQDNVVLVPTEAIQTGTDGQYVYIVDNNDQAHQIPVVTGLVGDGVTEVTSGLAGGERLVTVGQFYLTEGSSVRVVSAEV